jgi:hypothetical protein
MTKKHIIGDTERINELIDEFDMTGNIDPLEKEYYGRLTFILEHGIVVDVEKLQRFRRRRR